MASILDHLWCLLFPLHFEPCQDSCVDQIDFDHSKIKQTVSTALTSQIAKALESQNKADSYLIAEEIVSRYLEQLPELSELLRLDAQAASEKDPSVESIDEVILAYPGFLALMTYRLAHKLSLLGVPLIPRMMSEVAHARTGCDIHPDAKIGKSLFIDHATGVVIGQTAVVGDRVTLFQGVTLGALALQERGQSIKRHPTIEDDVIIYANATILGGDTVVGKRSIIGGSCWITFSVEPDTKVILANPRAMITQTKKAVEYIPNWDI